MLPPQDRSYDPQISKMLRIPEKLIWILFSQEDLMLQFGCRKEAVGSKGAKDKKGCQVFIL